MVIPDFQTCMLPLLRILEKGEELSAKETTEKIADHCSLTDEERAVRLPSGKQTVISNRVGWARSYMKKAGLVEFPQRGRVRITNRGKELLATNPAAIDVAVLKTYPEFSEAGNRAPKPDDAEPTPSKLTPEEQLDAAYEAIRSDLETEILQLVQSYSPSRFEQIVVDLLVRMGYGGTHEDAGKVLGKSGDEGVDGVIKEDRLGLDLLYVQAKRWENQVSRPEIQKFAGALQGKRARKGVFITTSTFSQGAREFAENIESRIVLIDGSELARLMVDHGLGVSTERVYEIKRIDRDYFDDES